MEIFRWFSENKDWVTIPLRITLAILFIVGGAGKLFGTFGGSGLEGFSGMLAANGFPAAMFFAVLVAIVELLGGIALLTGFLTRYASVMLSIIMIVAILSMHLNSTYPLALTALGGTLALLFAGAGPLSVDAKRSKGF